MYGRNSFTHKYVNHQYPENHWAVNHHKERTNIGIIRVKNLNYLVKLNPTDRRGYRALIIYIGDDQSNIQTTFNRTYTFAEQKGLSDVTTVMIEIYKKIGLPIVQTAQLANDSHSLVEKSRIIQMGKKKIPHRLHMHVWGRGDPLHEYIEDIPLGGPSPGETLDMRGKTPHVPGNEKKVRWQAKEIELALKIFKEKLHDFQNSPEFKTEFGDLMQINLFDEKTVRKAMQRGFYLNNKSMVGLTFSAPQVKTEILPQIEIQIETPKL